jgi:hypothetical protein
MGSDLKEGEPKEALSNHKMGVAESQRLCYWLQLVDREYAFKSDLSLERALPGSDATYSQTVMTGARLVRADESAIIPTQSVDREQIKRR